MSPKFSIVTPTYNRAYILPKAINSIRNQSFKDWEHISVDDGSTDNTDNVVDDYVKRVCSPHNYKSKVVGLRYLRGDEEIPEQLEKHKRIPIEFNTLPALQQ